MTDSRTVRYAAGEDLSNDWRDGFADLTGALRHWELWMVIGWIEISQRYRRSFIGPFWITLSLGLVVGGLGVVYSTLFKQSAAQYIPYLATGLIAWTFVSTLITESCTTFIAAEGSIKMLPVPLSVYVYRMAWRNLIILAHNIVVYLVVIAIFGINPGFSAVLGLVGIAVVALNGVGFALALGSLSVRFRDIPMMIANAVQLVFFVTPILWRPELLAERAWIYRLNPFHYLVEVIRAPLLGTVPPASTWAIVLLFTAANLALGIVLFCRLRWRIAYWV